MAFGTDVRRLRKARGLSLEELAERAGLSANYMGSIELGRRDPSLSSVKAIAKGLGVPVSQLIKDKGAPLGPVAVEVGQLFESVPQKLQDAVVSLLRAVSDETAEPARGRPPRAAPRRSARG